MASSQARFSLSVPSSPSSSRSTSPVPHAHENDSDDDDNVTTPQKNDLYKGSPLSRELDDAFAPEDASDVYDTTLPAWRAWIRRKVLHRVEKETPIVAKLQEAIRTPFFDAYFVYTSSLGTHTFFMTVLPAMFFFGLGDLGRGLLLNLVSGVYLSSFVKDLICSPRPFAPPVTRLTIGSHHLEYGFPSTHSTNSVSLALFFFSLAHRLASVPTILFTGELGAPLLGPNGFYAIAALLSVYMVSIVFGRLYTAMHSFTDCVAGCLMGASIWFFFDDWMGMGVQSVVERWIQETGWAVPAIIIPLGLFLVHKHPVPVDDCPCFEDAIAFNSVLMGALSAHWTLLHIPSLFLPTLSSFSISTLLSSFLSLPHTKLTYTVMPSITNTSLSPAFAPFFFAGLAFLKMVFGVLCIFAWRIIAKLLAHHLLPPLFRFLSSEGFQLPHRRFYTPATDYNTVPTESMGGLRAVPSLLDLPGTVDGVGAEFDGDGIGEVVGEGQQKKLRGPGAVGSRGSDLKLRNGNGNGDVAVPNGNGTNEKTTTFGDDERRTSRRKHYDADVLTKVFVYSGIGILATEALPAFFDAVGWGVGVW